MIDRLFGGDAFIATTRALDAASLRHQVIANNLANVNTPGYKRQAVQFETQLAQALQANNNACAPANCVPVASVTPRVVTINSTSERTDGNNVDMETEMANLAANTLTFEVLSQSVSGYFAGLKAVINGR
ncbi:MAG TPA: flagellar basal body rod protein FlgB [Chthonomonadaceae bacterium]|nr:flagellar basal body rod protein FlgB [Chthonomonadaceae bacterium]